MTNKHTALPLLAKGNMYDNDGFPCVIDANDCVVFSVWDEGRTIEQAEKVAVDIATAVNYHHRLREALDDALETLEVIAPRHPTRERIEALLVELDNQEDRGHE